MNSIIATSDPTRDERKSDDAHSFRATYSPEDNKLRLYSGHVGKALYERLKSAGFTRAYKQGCFVAPAWSPEREDLLLELCSDIGDEDTSLMERAEQRAERFEEYGEYRREDAAGAQAAVAAITEHIPMGQPILVGHHSEAHARRDAERIENNMRKAVKMWDTSQYWLRRAEGAVRHARYKERPDVRHRRISGLEADLRRVVSRYTPDPRTRPQVWDNEKHVWCGQGRGGHWVKESSLEAIKVHTQRWEMHYRNRIAYERAMLDEAGGLPADQFDFQKGGRALVGGEWVVVLKVNKSAGKVVSVTTNARYVRVKGIEEITDYRPPTAEEIQHTQQATRLPPLVNYRSEGCLEMTKMEWKRYERSQSGYAKKIAPNAEHGAHRQRTVYRGGRLINVFINDAKVIDRPPSNGEAPVALPRERVESPIRTVREEKPVTPYDVMREQLRGGAVQSVSVPQLFPTPIELARRMVQMASRNKGFAGKRVLEPSAGTGNLLKAIVDSAAGADCVRTVAVEIDRRLCGMLEEVRNLTLHANEQNHRILCADFLECDEELGLFDAIVVNPPFTNLQDVRHVTHALKFLKPTGRLVAVMSNGLTFRTDRFTSALKALIEKRGGTIELLPEHSFAESGTQVSTVLVTIDG